MVRLIFLNCPHEVVLMRINVKQNFVFLLEDVDVAFVTREESAMVILLLLNCPSEVIANLLLILMEDLTW